MGMVTTVIQCGAIGPYLSGLLRDSTGSFSTALMAMLVPLPFAMLAMGWLTDKS
jgi:cyanate permease